MGRPDTLPGLGAEGPLTFRDYEAAAAVTDHCPIDSSEHSLALNGLAFKAGELLRVFGKRHRDGEAYAKFQDEAKLNLGDALWYLDKLARDVGLRLEDVALDNIRATRDRWGQQGAADYELFDADYPPSEQLPRRLVVRFRELGSGSTPVVGLFFSDQFGNEFRVGDALTDNASEPDGYRFHDIHHLAYAAILGWSPVIRKLLSRKRKSRPEIDENQDGARARDIEEALTASLAVAAKEAQWFVGVEHLDTSLLRDIRDRTAHLEVRTRSMRDWETAILSGYAVFRKVLAANGGCVTIDLLQRAITYDPI